jgi:hypothetical protein
MAGAASFYGVHGGDAGGTYSFNGRRLTQSQTPSIDSIKPGLPPPGLPGGGSTSNKTNFPTQLTDAQSQMAQRAAGDMGAGRAIDVAGGKIREAAIGLSKESQARRAARGVAGTGADAWDAQRVNDQTARAIAGTAADITQGREQARDSLLASSGQLAGTMAGISQADRSLALQQWQTIEANRRADEEARLQKTLAQLQILNQVETF